MSEPPAAEELGAEVERLTEMRDRLLQTVNEQGAARVADYETMRGMLAELVWRRKEMGDPPEGEHDFQRPGAGVERQCAHCGVRYSAWFGNTSCPDEETTT
ncbi:hypothetical protein [Streptomyces antibioticus]|uniref:hypothetical protein n=1 Tax=Streptomyces antibioticus TaxID=1890 RepID=UPI0033E4DC32